jgi:hypothetical protein
MGQSADQLRREIEYTRMGLSEDLDAIGDRMSPRRMAERRWNRMGRWMGSARERVFGTAQDMTHAAGSSVAGSAQAVADRAHSLTDAVSDAPQAAAHRTQGNPAMAGAVAFGVGFLGSLVFGSAEVEQEAVGRIAEKAKPIAEPIKEELTSAAQDVASTVKEQGQEIASDLAEEARDRAGEVKSAAQDAAQETRDQASAPQGSPTSSSWPTV